MNKLIVSFFFIGFLPLAPGTFGSLAGILLGLILQSIGGFPLLILSILLIFMVGWHCTIDYISTQGKSHDPKEIVIDEVVGQLVSYTPISLYIWVYESGSLYATFYDWLIAFILFRLFDIIKPWPVSLADKMQSALGVMLDDIIAGFFTAVLICAIIFLFN